MKTPILASLLAPLLISGLALADNNAPPKGPDFVAVAPPRGVDRTLVASSGMQPIEPLEIVNFALDSTALDPAALSQLDVLATWMKKYPEQNLVIEGHTDRLGSASYNLDLGERRAIAVRAHLRGWGVSGDRVIVATFGERGAHETENANDRRVVVFASDRPRTELVHDVIQHTRAHSVVWTDRGAKISVTK